MPKPGASRQVHDAVAVQRMDAPAGRPHSDRGTVVREDLDAQAVGHTDRRCSATCGLLVMRHGDAEARGHAGDAPHSVTQATRVASTLRMSDRAAHDRSRQPWREEISPGRRSRDDERAAARSCPRYGRASAPALSRRCEIGDAGANSIASRPSTLVGRPVQRWNTDRPNLAHQPRAREFLATDDLPT